MAMDMDTIVDRCLAVTRLDLNMALFMIINEATMHSKRQWYTSGSKEDAITLPIRFRPSFV